jgi:hypothetical protein
MDKGRTSEVGWFPRQGSYEEAVLNWYEQIETSFRRRDLEAQRAGQVTRVRRGLEDRIFQQVSD